MPPGLLIALVAVAAAPCSCNCCEVRHDLSLRCTSGACASTCTVGGQPEELARLDFANIGEGENATAAKAAGEQLAVALDSKEVDSERFCWASCVPAAEVCEAGTPVDPPAREATPATAPPPARLRGALVKTQASTGVAVEEPEHLKDLAQVSVRSEDDAKVAGDELALATQAAKIATNVHVDAMRFEPAVSDDVKQAQEEAARGALDAQAADSMLDQSWKAARSAAGDVEQDTVKAMRKEAHDKAEKEARKVGEELQKKMKAAAGPAGLAAMKPYNDAMAGAASAAAGWVKQGDGASGLSFQLGMQASMLMGQANQWNAVGQYAKAQNMLRDSLDLSRQADGLAGAAQNAYDQAAGIMSTLGGYVTQAGMAQYHAQYMLDPESYPPVAFG